jgi:acyl CoA:acetate/3-ketoacid CoA transferase beta subunit
LLSIANSEVPSGADVPLKADRIVLGADFVVRQGGDFVMTGIGLPSVWENLKNQMFLGSEDFVLHVRDKLNSMEKDGMTLHSC